jgi:lysophospholipid acyltransferase (LPLAT)-like uncharacterized protein
MKQRHRWLIPHAASVIAHVVRGWMRTMRVKIASRDGRQHPVDPAEGRLLYAFWHEGLLAPLATKPKIRVLISQHTDGELIAQVCQRLGIGVIRGSTARGGCAALLDMIRSAEGPAHLGITPDGPRGPRRVLKPGVVIVASQTGLPIVPVGIGFSRAWRFTSWDRFALPLPGSTLTGVIGEPMVVPADLSRPALAQWVARVESALAEVTDLAESWAQRIREQGSSAPGPW